MRNVGRAKTSASIVLVGIDSDQMGLVRECLAAEAALPANAIGFNDAANVVARTRPDVVIVGFRGNLDTALTLAQVLHEEVPHSTLVALSNSSSAEAILAAMRVGYKEFVVLPEDAARLRQTVHAAAYAPDDDEEKGLVVSCIGAKGGVGCTLVASHLAAELAAIHRVIFIDLDFSVGDAAPMLDLSPRDNVVEVLSRADRLDERMLTGSVAVHRSKVHVLCQPDDLEATTGVHQDDVYSVVLAAAKGYQYVFCDLGCRSDETARLVASVSDLVVVVTTPDVISVRDAFRRLRLLERNGVEKDRIRLVVNRATKTAYITDQAIEENLGIKVTASIADDPRTVGQAMNEGKLIREVNRKSDAARDLSRLVSLLTQSGDAVEPEKEQEESKGFFFGLFGRG